MLARIIETARSAACRTLGLFTAEDLRTAALRVERACRSIAEERKAEIARLEALVEDAQPRVSPAVAAVCCPRCGAQLGERCQFATGEPMRRTHRERTEAWREMEAASEAKVEALMEETERAAEGS